MSKGSRKTKQRDRYKIEKGLKTGLVECLLDLKQQNMCIANGLAVALTLKKEFIIQLHSYVNG